MKSVKIGTLIVASLLTMNTFAQKQKNAKAEVKTEKIERGELTPEQLAARRTEYLNKQLTLSEDQKNKIYEINLLVNNKNKVVREDKSTTAEFKRDSLKGNNESREYLIRETLTEEQKAKFDELKAKKADHDEHDHDGHSHN